MSAHLHERSRPGGLESSRAHPTSTSSRRHFDLCLAAVGATIASRDAAAQGVGSKLRESDPQGVALG